MLRLDSFNGIFKVVYLCKISTQSVKRLLRKLNLLFKNGKTTIIFFMEISIFLQPFQLMKNLVMGGWTDRLQLTDWAVYQKVTHKGSCMQRLKI